MRTITEERRPTTPDATREPAPRLDTGAWLRERIPSNLALFVGVAWYVLFFIGMALEPEPTHPDVIPVWLGATIDVALLGLLAVTAAGLLARRRWGLVASMGAATFFAGLSVACPVSGHHGFGAWWYGQMACAIGLVAISIAALRRSGAPD
jgi:4-amino-4-deoxy-L-arabinose transferase-like glycosyltransferase